MKYTSRSLPRCADEDLGFGTVRATTRMGDARDDVRRRRRATPESATDERDDEDDAGDHRSHVEDRVVG